MPVIDMDELNEVELKDRSLWVTVGNVSVHVWETSEGVMVTLYPLDHELGEPLAGCWAAFQDAYDRIEGEE